MSNVVDLADERATRRRKTRRYPSYEAAMADAVELIEAAHELADDPVVRNPLARAITILRLCHSHRNPGQRQ